MTLRRISVKKLEGLGFTPSSTLQRGKPMARKAAARRRPVARVTRRASSTFDDATVAAILERDGRRCVRHGGVLYGDRGIHWSVQHRRARGMGGTVRPDTSQPQNGIALCGSATTGCHGWVEAHPAEAEANGWRVPQAGDPLKVPVVYGYRANGTNTHFLHSDGSRQSRPEVSD